MGNAVDLQSQIFHVNFKVITVRDFKSVVKKDAQTNRFIFIVFNMANIEWMQVRQFGRY
jgi:hypothetical protein